MDHWGDPWADNANDRSPTKNAVTSPLPPAFNFVPVPLSGFVDDAGWGNNNDDGFGDWTTSATANVASTDVVSTPAGDKDPGSAGWGTVTHDEREDRSVGWPEIVSKAPQDLEKVDSEPSDSSTVSQLDEAVSEDTVEEPTPQPQTDVESSVRSSTSPSETSRNELPIESPRTSIEDERSTKKEVPQNEQLVVIAELEAVVADTGDEVTTVEGNEDMDGSKAIEGTEEQSADAGETEISSSRLSDDQRTSRTSGELDSAPDDTAAADAVQPHAQLATFVCDKATLAQLFPSNEEIGKQLDEHDDPIFSTSARKAWYRLTRKQTMREFNHGDNDDNYIRVTWANSHVRAEVHKVVSRWAREDRISGTGPGARASFYWDTPAPAEPETSFGHLRTQSSVPVTKTALPARQSLPPLAANQAAPFNWSSPTSTDPWKIESPTERSTSRPLALKNPTVAKLQRQEGRAVSVDLTPRQTEQTMHKRTATVSHAVPETTPTQKLTSSPTSQVSAEVSDPCADSTNFDSPPTPTVEAAAIPVDDDDDDWGEMVQTPTLPTPQQLDPFSPDPTVKAALPPPPSPKPSSPVTTPVQSGLVEPMFASPVVRLQSTISPTSALFKANTFVPLHAEQGPIGPEILKPRNRSVRSTPDKTPKAVVPERPNTERIDLAPMAPVTPVIPKDSENGGNEETSAWTIPELVPLPIEPEVTGDATAEASEFTQSSTPVQASVDSWADADFSFFESALPAATQSTVVQMHDPSGPFSFFDTPAPTSPASRPFSQSPLRDTTQPPLQPYMNATSSLQRRKAEDDEVINDILSGLPNLSYMLQ